jgi:hypothetical protein
VKVRFACPQCESPDQADVAQPQVWRCHGCSHTLHLEAADPALPVCVVCGNAELYKKKNFPHALGMAILVVVCVAFLIAQFWYHVWYAWAILIGGAAFDWLLYGLVGDVIVCYRCHAHYRHLQASPAHRPFEISIGERYRQERLRREQLKMGQ